MSEDSDDLAQLRVDFARALEQLRNLEVALESSRIIGAAVGIVMATRKLRYDAAFETIRALSARNNRRVRDIADRIVLTGSVPEPNDLGL